ncbi:MAG: zinc ribbon domain-containing protein [Pseudomonadota bacterium]
MPIYEYECCRDGKRFEVLKKITDNSEEKCPDCGSEAKKLISQSTFHLKGSGWYATDYAKKNSPPPSQKQEELSDKAASKYEKPKLDDKKKKKKNEEKKDTKAA